MPEIERNLSSQSSPYKVANRRTTDLATPWLGTGWTGRSRLGRQRRFPSRVASSCIAITLNSPLFSSWLATAISDHS